ncbi:MAG: glycoside hydrolase family 88 protein [Bacteroidales bacterium]|nr:glycoside hydrolase family 88 protein [Bacteroidales bacterium]MCF8390058.1 glycoside hydrolase family 88 protein [Bacteroidales bacterium]
MKKFVLIFTLNILSFGSFLNAQNIPKHSFKDGGGLHSESFKSLTFNGSWCWFSDPRAVYYEGLHNRTYVGWIDNFGDVTISYYDNETSAIQSKVLYDNLETDDHNNPTILFDEKGHLLVFFNKHNGGMYFTRSVKPEDISEWTEVKKLDLNDTERYNFGRDTYTYTNPIKLSAEKGRIYLFWRGIDGKPSYSTSDDNGESWSKGAIFFMPEKIYDFRRPYVKYYSDGKDKIHIALTDGHPRNEDKNSIYYMYYKNGAFYRADGKKIRSVEEEAHGPGECDKVYDASPSGQKAWIWDIAADEKGLPVLAYAKFPDDKNHIYSYAKWDGSKWNNYDLINSGAWFPETRKGLTESEPNYSGGLNIDHENTNILYLSVNRDSVFEIEKWETKNGGKSWKSEAISHGSSKDNVRPFAVRGATERNPLQVLWQQNSRYLYFAWPSKWRQELNLKFGERYHSSIKINMASPLIQNPLSKEDILNIMHQTADWQLANPWRKSSRLDWHWGAFYTGLRALYEVTGEDRYKNEMINIGQSNNWKPMDDIFHADRLTIADNWIWLYSLEKDPVMIEKIQWAMDIHLARDYKKATDVRFVDNENKFEWWTWCDALYMAPPSFALLSDVTGDPKYLNYADAQWWKTSDYLYSKEDSLFFRDDRFFDDRTENGKKVFWSRGNGWVIAGLARMLSSMPSDYKGREKFEQQYREMAHKILSIQGEDGLWRVSLDDPGFLNIGESSGSAFFTFALAWGINNNLLDKKYKPQVEKAWIALTKNVNEWGRLGYVQQVAGSPEQFYEDQWQVYATGAFLLAGKEMLEL